MKCSSCDRPYLKPQNSRREEQTFFLSVILWATISIGIANVAIESALHTDWTAVITAGGFFTAGTMVMFLWSRLRLQ